MADFLTYKNFLILVVLAFCGYASYTDIRWGKIKNYCSFGLIYVGLLAQLLWAPNAFAGHCDGTIGCGQQHICHQRGPDCVHTDCDAGGWVTCYSNIGM